MIGLTEINAMFEPPRGWGDGERLAALRARDRPGDLGKLVRAVAGQAPCQL